MSQSQGRPSSPPSQALWARAINPILAPVYHRLRYPRLKEFPSSIILETTSRCNLNCVMCPRRNMTRPAQDVDPELFRGLVAQIAEHDRQDAVEFVALHWFGEPLLHPRLLEMIHEAGEALPNLRRRGELRNAVRGLNTSTNATLLDAEMVEGLLESPLTWLAVSVDGSTAETYGMMRGGGRDRQAGVPAPPDGGARFEQVLANVERLLAINRRRPRALPTIAIQIIVTRATAPEIEAFRQRWEPNLAGAENARVELKPYTDWAGQVDAPELCGPARGSGFLYLNCGYLYDTQVIGAGGEIGLCCYDVNAQHDLGNAGRQSLRDLWHGEALEELRGKMARGALRDLPLCARCAMGRKHPADYLLRRKRCSLANSEESGGET